MYHKGGRQINNSILTQNGIYVDYSDIILWICIKHEDPDLNDWSKGYSQPQLLSEFEYNGPLPSGSEVLLVGNFLIKKMEFGGGYPSHY